MCKDFMVKIMSLIKYVIKDLNKCRHDHMPLINYTTGPNSLLYDILMPLPFYSAVPLNTEVMSISLSILSSEMESVVANAVHSRLIIDFPMPSMS